jgi:hypothetical protein
MATGRRYSSEVLYCGKATGWTTVSRWADNLKQAIGYTKWYVQEVERQGGEVSEAQAIVQDDLGNSVIIVNLEPVRDEEWHIVKFENKITLITPET